MTQQHTPPTTSLLPTEPSLQIAVAQFGFGQTRHRRQWPRINQFNTPTVCVRLPMRSLMAQAPQYLGHAFGINRPSLIGFADRDHGLRSSEHGSALQWVDQILHSLGLQDCTGEVWLHTFPRVCGFAFKPVSFWFCHNPAGQLQAVVAEVHNTFGEQHCYVLQGTDVQPLGNGVTVLAQKMFHVSPFFPVRGMYQFRWCVLNTRSVLRVDYIDALHQPNASDAVSLTTSIHAHHVPISFGSAVRALCAYPLQATTVVLRIHWQALKLWLKRAPFYSKPSPPSHTITLDTHHESV